MKKISVLIPCYNEEENVVPISEAVIGIITKELPQYDYELVFIDNDSTDKTRELLRMLCAKNPKIKAIFNARNFGQFNSPYYGILQVTGDCVISCDIASRAYEKIQKDIRVGITEKELAARLSLYMVLEGADTQPYGNILISGARTSLLHGIPSQKAIEYGDLVLMDYGCQYHGYLSDMTRTLVVGRATPKQKEVYRIEQQMVAAVEGFLKDGVSASDAYYESTKIIEGTEYFPYHYTGIGHGVGMFVHEIPFMSPVSKNIVHANNVMTVEPGIYIPGWGGIRIEDQLLITETGNENLISATKELIEL